MFTLVLSLSIFCLGLGVPSLPRQAEIDIISLIDPSANGTQLSKELWTGGVVPYIITANAFTEKELEWIRCAMDDIANVSCIQFVQRNDEVDYVEIGSRPNAGCHAHLGHVGGVQTMNLGVGCFSHKKGIPIHGLMHVLGLVHEEVRPDRDNYVEIVWDNMAQNAKHFFKIRQHKIDKLMLPYDYKSIMHSSEKAFSKNQKDTIIATNPHGSKIGQRLGLSELDGDKLNKLYQCP